MFYFLIIAAIVFFIAHIALLLASFPKSEIDPKRYFYSHLTLWITGGVVFVLVLLYSGSGQSPFLDYFNTPLKKAMILVFTFALSFVANGIVRLLIVPLLRKNNA